MFRRTQVLTGASLSAAPDPVTPPTLSGPPFRCHRLCAASLARHGLIRRHDPGYRPTRQRTGHRHTTEFSHPKETTVNHNHDQRSHPSRTRSRWGRRRRPAPDHNPTGQPSSVPAPEPLPAPAEGWTVQRVRALGVVTDLPTAGQVLGLSRTTAYALARQGRFPTRNTGVGKRPCRARA